MPKWKLPGQTSTVIDANTPEKREILFDLTNNRPRIGDGSTAGGKALAFQSETEALDERIDDLEANAVSDDMAPVVAGTIPEAQALLDQGNPFTDVASASTVDLGAVDSDKVRITGTTTITSFGTAPAGTRKLLRFAGQLTITYNGTSLIIANNAAISYITAANEMGEAVSLGSGNWVLIMWPSVIAKFDQSGAGGARPYSVFLGGDVTTSSADFKLSGNTTRVKTRTKSLLLSDPGDTSEIGTDLSNGTAASPSAWTGPVPGNIFYAHHPHISMTATTAPDNATYRTRRFAQQYFFQMQAPTALLREGGIAWGCALGGTGDGESVPWDRLIFKGKSFFSLGRAAYEDSGYSAPTFNYGTLSGNPDFNRIFCPSAAWNWYDAPEVGNIVIAMPDISNSFAGLAMRLGSDPTAGVDFVTNSGEWRLATVAASTRTSRWGLTTSGHWAPVTDGAVKVGNSNRRASEVHSLVFIGNQTSQTTQVGYLQASHATYTGDVLTLRSERASGTNHNFLTARADVSGTPNLVFKVAGNGQISTDQASVTTGGAGYGEAWEWDDGNPNGEDRIGQTVVALGRWRMGRAKDHPDKPVIGVASARCAMVGNAFENGWSGRFVRDDIGNILTELVDVATWETVETETQQVERVRKVPYKRMEPKREWRTRMIEEPAVEERDGVMVQIMVPREDSGWVSVVKEGPLFDEAGQPVLDPRTGEQIIASIPVMHEVEGEYNESYIEEVTIELARKARSCVIGEEREGLVIPKDAKIVKMERPILNPNFNPNQDYVPRLKRPEWDPVSYLGVEYVLVGERVPPEWLDLGEAFPAKDGRPAIHEYLVR